MTKLMNCGLADPQILLGMALEKRDITEFRIALDMGANPNQIIEKTQISIFEKALQMHGCVEFVNECLKRSCNAASINRQINKSALSFATDSRDPKILECLLNHSTANLDREYQRLTPLNSLAKNLSADNFEDVFACMKLLLDEKASLNVADQGERTPLWFVLKNKTISEEQKIKLIQEFLKHPIDLDTFRNGEARILLKNFMDLDLPSASTEEVYFKKLLVHLNNGNEEKFLNDFSIYHQNISHQDSMTVQMEKMELLKEAITKGLCKAFDAILDVVQDVNLLYNNNSAMFYACVYGNWYALRKLLAREDLLLREHEGLLITVIQNLQEQSYNDFCDYTKCFYDLIDSKKIDINETDPSGLSPLHYAVKYHNEMAIRKLLDQGAYIGSKSKFNDIAIEELEPELLEEHFDSCITTNGKKLEDEDFKIIINYRNLIPTQASEGKSAIGGFRQEMTPITHLAKSKHKRRLLMHPLITSFLFFKWYRLSKIFYMNLIVFIPFIVSFMAHAVVKFRESDYEEAIFIFGWLSCVGIAYLIVRELIQFLISPLNYLKVPINYMEILMIVLCIVSVSGQIQDEQTERVVAVVAILLLAWELSLLVGSLPVPSISTHMRMLKAVLNSFLKSFALYSIFVITFSMSFFILFGKEDEKKDEAPTTEKADDDKSEESGLNKFSNPLTAVVKTILMLTGEFDAGEIGFGGIYSYLVFLLFVIFMSIVLFNLLNGLAVNDTHEIKEQAELNGSICRTELLTQYERTLANPSQLCRKYRQKLINIFPHLITGSQIAIQPNNRSFEVFNAKSSFREMRDMQLSNSRKEFQLLLDNDCEQQYMKSSVHQRPCCLSWITNKCVQMDSKTVKMAIEVINQKNTRTQRKQLLDSSLESIQSRLESIESKLKELSESNRSVSP